MVLLQASISAEHGRWDVKKAKLKGMRKITPSQPQGASPRTKARLPSSVAAAAAAGQDETSKESRSVKVQLQQAFLEQYSPSDAKASSCMFDTIRSAGCTRPQYSPFFQNTSSAGDVAAQLASRNVQFTNIEGCALCYYSC